MYFGDTVFPYCAIFFRHHSRSSKDTYMYLLFSSYMACSCNHLPIDNIWLLDMGDLIYLCVMYSE